MSVYQRAACPACAQDKARPGDTAVSIHVPTGHWRCHRCGRTGQTCRAPVPAQRSSTTRKRERERRDQNIARIIGLTGPVQPGDPAWRYLRSRSLIADGKCSPDLRFGKLRHAPSGGGVLPCLVAVLRDTAGKARAIQRTYLTDRGRKISTGPARMLLGPSAGTAFRAGDPIGGRIAVAEGVEDALAVQQLYGLPAWALLGTSGFRGAQFPPEVREVVIAADGDPPGRAAADGLRGRLEKQGKLARIIWPRHGGDPNDDLLREQGGVESSGGASVIRPE